MVDTAVVIVMDMDMVYVDPSCLLCWLKFSASDTASFMLQEVCG